MNTDPKSNSAATEGCAAMAGSPGGRTVHMCIDIQGVLRRSDKDLQALFHEDGIKRTGKYVRDWLKLQLAKGKRVLPMGERCEGFDDVTGCPGHPCEAPESAPAMPTASDGCQLT